MNGFLEGEKCGRDGCGGIIEEREVENCACHINPPCSACTTPREHCESCGWQAVDDPECQLTTPKHKGEIWKQPIPKPLDNTKIDWRAFSHTHFSMIKRGVYPAGTTRDEVIKKVQGTFGGRFNYFKDGKFEYVAYTD
jgi:hypothetical protein